MSPLGVGCASRMISVIQLYITQPIATSTKNNPMKNTNYTYKFYSILNCNCPEKSSRISHCTIKQVVQCPHALHIICMVYVGSSTFPTLPKKEEEPGIHGYVTLISHNGRVERRQDCVITACEHGAYVISMLTFSLYTQAQTRKSTKRFDAQKSEKPSTIASFVFCLSGDNTGLAKLLYTI